MTTKLWTKKETQSVLKTLRREGYQVEKISYGYKVYDGGNDIVLEAMTGHRGYLIRYEEGFFAEQSNVGDS